MQSGVIRVVVKKAGCGPGGECGECGIPKKLVQLVNFSVQIFPPTPPVPPTLPTLSELFRFIQLALIILVCGVSPPEAKTVRLTLLLVG
jgi:hypothetical protein